RIVDTSGNAYQQAFNIVTASTNPSPLSIPLSGSTLVIGSSYTVTVTSNVVNSSIGTTCVKTVIKVVPPTTTSSCCPDIGNYTAVIASGTTTLPIVRGLSYTPRFVQYISKSAETSNIFSNAGAYI